jgi:hypothetical protein
MKSFARLAFVLVGLAGHGACTGNSNPDVNFCSKQICGGNCVDVATDPANCGACGKACKTNEGEVCDAGKCSLACGGGTKKCDSSCIDTKSDPANCGDCGKKCDAGQVCDGAGKCGFSCVKGQLACDGKCVDPLTDNGFCGAMGDCMGANAGKKCDPGNVCSAGKCGLSCAKDQVNCNGKCIDPLTDNGFCGASGDCMGANAGKACDPGNLCSAGMCGLTCAKDQLNCDGKCIDPKTSNTYCGAKDDCKAANAGTKCDPGNVCSDGKCGVACVSGQIVCNGKCIDPKTDNAFCGAKLDCAGMNAGIKCPAGQTCDGNGKCATSCLGTQVLCGGKCIDPKTDNAFCGASGDCLGLNAGSKCASGQVCDGNGKCATSCLGTQVLCNGKCIDPNTDNTYCGATGDCMGANDGTTCNAGFVCTNKVCTLSCQAGLINCGGKCIDPNVDPSFCGAKLDCSGANAGVKCSNNEACSAGVCKSGTFSSCNQILGLGLSNGDGIYTLDPDGAGGNASFKVYCDMTKDGGGWTLIARFSNADAKNWMQDNGDWWYDQIAEQGNPTTRSTNADALSKAFFSVSGDVLKISRTDNADDSGLLVTNAACVGNTTFRAFVTSFGNFRSGTWRPGGTMDGVAKTCAGTLGNNFATTFGFAQAQCVSTYGGSGALSFWAAFSTGDGAVMSIGGIGGTDATGCRRADHGIGITEADNPSFTWVSNNEGDFGDNNTSGNTNSPMNPGYALNLFIK